MSLGAPHGRAHAEDMETSALVLAVGSPVLAGGHYFTWGVISISVTNLAIIVAMVVVFVLALLVPFPHRHDDEDRS
jgi:uncharacterized membrane protein